MDLRNKIKKEIADELRMQQEHAILNDEDIQYQTNRLMQLIDNYSNQNGLLNTFTKQNTIAETALFNLYHHYFMQPMGSLWDVTFEDSLDPTADFTMKVTTKHFYGTKYSLTLLFETEPKNDNQVTITDLETIYENVKDKIKPDKYRELVHEFQTHNLGQYNQTIGYHGLANQLEFEMYQILELCRYLYEDNFIRPDKKYLSTKHIARIEKNIWKL